MTTIEINFKIPKSYRRTFLFRSEGVRIAMKTFGGKLLMADGCRIDAMIDETFTGYQWSHRIYQKIKRECRLMRKKK